METETVSIQFKHDTALLKVKVIKGTVLPIPYSDAFKLIDFEGKQVVINFKEVLYIRID